MEVKLLDSKDFYLWDGFLDQSPQGSLFAKTWYVSALQIEFDVYVVMKNAAVLGGILIAKDKWGYNINPVFGKYLGVCYADFEGSAYTVETNKRKVLKALFPKLNALKSFEFTFHPNFKNWMLFQRNNFQQTTNYTYRIAFNSQSRDEILQGMHTRLRNKIVKVQKEDLEFRAIPDFHAVLPLFQQTFKKQNIKFPIENKILQNLLTVLHQQNSLEIIGAYKNNKLQSAIGLFYDKKVAYLMLNGVQEDSINGSNEALVFASIQWAQENGLLTFDFEGSMLPKIESFYRQFGGELTPYYKIWKQSKMRQLRQLKQKVF